MATEAEIAWAAGLFEGEGCFRITKARGKSQCAMLVLQMTDRDAVQRFRDIVGAGNVRTQLRPEGHKTIYCTDVASRPDVERIIRAFMPWLCARRKAKAQELLAHIAILNAAAEHRAAFCKRGHPWVPENIYVNPRGIRACLRCKQAASREWSRMKYATDPEYARRNREASREYAKRKRADPDFVRRRNERRRKARAGVKPAI